jgi:hypothetical protein
MTEARSISEALAPLIFQAGIPLKTIAVVGEIITLDSRVQDYGNGPNTGEELGKFLEAYDVLLQRAQSAVAEFLISHDREVLMKIIPEIREELATL